MEQHENAPGREEGRHANGRVSWETPRLERIDVVENTLGPSNNAFNDDGFSGIS